MWSNAIHNQRRPLSPPCGRHSAWGRVDGGRSAKHFGTAASTRQKKEEGDEDEESRGEKEASSRGGGERRGVKNASFIVIRSILIFSSKDDKTDLKMERKIVNVLKIPIVSK